VKASKLSIAVLALIFFFNSTLPVYGVAYKFGLDDQNTRKIKDSFTETGFPFQEDWLLDLGGKVMSQPIVAEGYIYVQAGKDLVKISLEEKRIVDRITVTDHELPSGSSPTYAVTTHAPRIYQATRDHKLIAIDVNTFKKVWEIILTIDENSDNNKKRYRVTSSPLVYIHDNGTYFAIGTANGDGTGFSEQYADNGFFIIHDTGLQGKINYKKQMEGEVTGSPILHNNMIIDTENTQDKESLLIRYFPDLNCSTTIKGKTRSGVPGSPAAEGDYVYVADRTGSIYKYLNKSETEINELWQNPSLPGDFDYTRPLNSYTLFSPTIGNKYIYLPIQHYNSASFNGPGAVIADSYLLITDGQGIMHAYKADNPVNFQAVSLAPIEVKAYETGEMMELCFTVKNTSGKDYTNIPVEFITPEGEIIPGGKISLAAGEEKTLYWGEEVPADGKAVYQATINPEGHPEEIKEEIKPRLDNTAVYELNKNSWELSCPHSCGECRETSSLYLHFQKCSHP